jgi:hypothetical protein
MALEVGKGAKFWAYISPSNNTAKAVTKWSVTIAQKDGNWIGTITSANPYEQLQTPGLSGVFNVKVTGSGPKMPEHQLTPQAGSNPDIGCNSNCAAMVGIVATPDGTDANYWTVWDAYCERV